MPHIEILGPEQQIYRRMEEDLRGARSASIAVAFAKQSALQVLPLESFCHSGGSLRLLAGVDFLLTELPLIRRLEALPGVECKLYHQLSDEHRRTFHPKVYVIDKPDSRVAYVGSSNLTRGGLRDNIEANVRLEGSSECAELKQAGALFDQLFTSAMAAPLDLEFEERYVELQDEQRKALLYSRPTLASQERFHAAEAMLLSHYRAKAARCWVLVVSPEHFAVCMKERVWGREKESQIRKYAPGDLFFFHINQRGIAAMGMFIEQPYFEARQLWPPDQKGRLFSWRVRFRVLGELRTGLPTRKILEPLRPGAPGHWFNGFIQQSHGLQPNDFAALHAAFETAVRDERGLSTMNKG